MTSLLVVQAGGAREGEAARSVLAEAFDPSHLRWVCRGPVVAVAVRTGGNENALRAAEEVLRQEHPFFARMDGFNHVHYRIVEDLAVQTESHLLRLPRCAICRNLEPFPTQVELIAEAGICLRRRYYCLSCVARAAEAQVLEGRRTRQPLVADLLMADPRGLRFRGARLVKQRSRTGVGVFRVERDAAARPALTAH
jgi:hypothetical protein